MYDRAKPKKVGPLSAAGLAIDSGRPVTRSKGSPFLAACRRSETKLSASAFVRKVLDRSLPPTFQRTTYEGVLLEAFRRMSQIRTS